MSEVITQLAASFERQSWDYEEGIDAQFEINRQRALKDGFVIPNSREFRFSENNVSGQAEDRREWERLVDTVESKRARFTRVYIKARPRFGRWRDPREHVYWELRFEKLGVSLIYGSQQRQINLRDGMRSEDIGQYVMNILEGVNGALELTTTVDRVTTGMRSKVLRGFYPNGNAPYGCERWVADGDTGELIKRVPEGEQLRVPHCSFKLKWTDDRKLEAVKFIFDQIVAGYGVHSIATKLNERGFPTPTKGVPWSASSVLNVARNPIYCGTLVWGRHRGKSYGLHPEKKETPRHHTEAEAAARHPIRYERFMPNPPVSVEQFELAQRLLNGSREEWRKRHATSPDYLLAGLLKCRSCGGGFHGTTAKGNPERWYYYYQHTWWAPRGKASTCPKRRHVSAPDVEAAVLASFTHLLTGGELERVVRTELQARLQSTRSDEHQTRVVGTRKSLEKTQKALEAAVRNSAFYEGAAADVNKQVAEGLSKEVDLLNAELVRLENEGEELERLLAERTKILEMAGRLEEVFLTADLYQRKEVIAALVPRIELDAETLQIWLRLRIL